MKMSKYFKYYEEMPNKKLKEVTVCNKYIVNNSAFFIIITKKFEDETIFHSMFPSPTIGIPISFTNTDKHYFKDVEHLFNDCVNEFKKFYEFIPLRILVVLKELNSKPEILLTLQNGEYGIIYNFNEDNIQGILSTAIPNFLTKDIVYFKEYEDAYEAFKDPTLLNYIDVLNEI